MFKICIKMKFLLFKIKWCGRFISYQLELTPSKLTPSVSYGPNQGFELAVPLRFLHHIKYE